MNDPILKVKDEQDLVEFLENEKEHELYQKCLRLSNSPHHATKMWARRTLFTRFGEGDNLPEFDMDWMGVKS